MTWHNIRFGDLYVAPSRNGLTRPAAVRGSGYKMVNMGELFAYRQIGDIEMERVQLNERELGNFLIEEGDLLFARQSLVLEGAGKCVYVKKLSEPTTFESHIIRVRLKTQICDPLFYFYLFNSRFSGISSIVQQCAQAGIRGSMLSELPVIYPPLPTQQRIADILSAYDDLIENNRRRIALLEDAARQLYREWFVRLRFPGAEHTPQTNGLPEGWEYIPASSAMSINPTTRLSDDAEHWWVEMANLSENSMVIKSAVKREARSGSRFQNGDTLFARITPCLENGKTGYVDFMQDGEVGAGSTEFIVLRSQKLTPEYVYCLARTYGFREHAIKSMVGSSGRQRVQIVSFDDFFVVVPPKTLLNLFSDFAVPSFKQVKFLRLQNQKLKEARDLLLPKLMSGEIPV